METTASEDEESWWTRSTCNPSSVGKQVQSCYAEVVSVRNLEPLRSLPFRLDSARKNVQKVPNILGYSVQCCDARGDNVGILVAG